MKKIIINADDFGFAPGVCQGIVEAAERGAISSTSAMICSASFIRNIDASLASLTVPCGLHLQLTDGEPLSTDMRQHLVRTTGSPCFPTEFHPEAYPAALVAVEWGRQCDEFIERYGRPSHLDSHHWAHRSATFTAIYAELALELGVPVRGGSPVAHDTLESLGVASTRDVFSLGRHVDSTAAAANPANLDHLIAPSSASEICELLVHPGYVDEALLKISTLTYRREVELKTIQMPALRAWLNEQGYQVVDYGAFRD